MDVDGKNSKVIVNKVVVSASIGILDKILLVDKVPTKMGTNMENRNLAL